MLTLEEILSFSKIVNRFQLRMTPNFLSCPFPSLSNWLKSSSSMVPLVKDGRRGVMGWTMRAKGRGGVQMQGALLRDNKIDLFVFLCSIYIFPLVFVYAFVNILQVNDDFSVKVFDFYPINFESWCSFLVGIVCFRLDY